MPGEAIETEAELQVVVRFVIPRGKTEVTVSEALSLGYDQSSDADHGPVWVAEEEVLSLQPSKTVRKKNIHNFDRQFYLFTGCVCYGPVLWTSFRPHHKVQMYCSGSKVGSR